MGITMADIARATNSSIATVGRVLHNSGYVSDEARARIQRAIADMGYIPNQNARTLKRSRSGIIGSLVTSNMNGLYYRINESIMDAAYKNGFEYLTMEVQKRRHDEGRLISNFIGLSVEALVITSNTGVTPDMFQQLRLAGIPAVAVERGYINQGVDSLLVEDAKGVHHAISRMAAKGHRRVAIVSAPPVHEVEKNRLSGYEEAVRDFELSTDVGLIRIMDSYAPEAGREAGEALMALKNPPTAIFATADTLAAGVLQALYARKLRVPDDVSLAGYDDVLSRSLSPRIDSVALKLDDIGEKVLEMINFRLKNPDTPAREGTIQTVYMDRESVHRIDN